MFFRSEGMMGDVAEAADKGLEFCGLITESELQDVPQPKQFQPHECNPKCIEWIDYNPDANHGRNPLSIPLHHGWQRLIEKLHGECVVSYTAPCGKRLLSMKDVHEYLQICMSTMSVDIFDFDFRVNVLAEFTLPTRHSIVSNDITRNKENAPIPVVNCLKPSVPDYFMYESTRKPFGDFPLNLDPEFLCGCDCTDDCQDKEKCACWQLTLQSFAVLDGVSEPNVGYCYKRLNNKVVTGIYECNTQCKCSKKTCLNRVVQHPLQLRLQVFKTANKGWALRCLHDIPKGTFICTFSGYLHTNNSAVQEGKAYGREYQALLDCWKIVQRQKLGYESEAERDSVGDEEHADVDGSENHSNNNERNLKLKHREDSGKDLTSTREARQGETDETTRHTSSKRPLEVDVGESNFVNTTEMNKKKKDQIIPVQHDGDKNDEDDNVDQDDHEDEHLVDGGDKEDDDVFIVDARSVGNIGRFLNHSCSPNTFIQSVFVDSHDIHLPWVAFFAQSYIRAGEELTWNYNYALRGNSRKIVCKCGSKNCLYS